MTSLVQWFNKSSEYEIDGKKLAIKIIGTSEKPWFKANDVCKALGYARTDKALIDHVKPQYKSKLNDIISGSPEMGDPSFRRDREGQQPYISEPGVYALIFGSKLPTADAFRTWVFEDVLPSIRQQGEYNLKQSLLLKDAEIVKTNKEVADRDQQLAIKTAEMESLAAEIELEKKKAIHFKKMADRQKAREKNHVVYVATTKTYALNNRFKIGGVKSMSLLKGRLSTYNSGRPVGDKMYYAHIVSCVNYTHLEAKMKEILGAHREVEDAEVYNLHYNDVKFFVDFLSTRYNEEIDLHETRIDELVANVLNLKPVVPEPLVLNGAELRSIVNGRELTTVQVDFDAMDDIEQNEWLKRVLQEIKDSKSGDMITIERRSLFDEMERNYAAKFNKTKMWSRLKPIANDLSVRVKY
jgi:prophage antirepressor-like protein